MTTLYPRKALHFYFEPADLINHGGHMEIVEKKERKSNAKTRVEAAMKMIKGKPLPKILLK